MRHTFKLFAFIMLGLMASADLFGQAQIYTRREKLKDITAKTIKIVLTGDDIFDEAMKESVSQTWTMSPYEFCTSEEFEKLKTSDKYYFMLVVKGQQRKESEPGIDLLTMVKGGEGASKSIDDMLEVLSFPLRSAKEPSGREFTMLPAFLSIMQDHAQGLIGSEFKAYSSLGAKDTKRLRIKQIYFSREDFAPQVESGTIESLDEDIKVEEDDEAINEIFLKGTFNAVVGYVVAPTEPVNGSVCYKMLIGADDHKLYWYKKHRISAKNGAGFLDSDLKAIKLLRK